MSFYDATPAYVESYLNAQLGSLWNNAVACLEKLESSQSLEKPNRYFVSLAKYTPKESSAQVMFDRPTVKIICNHEILLKLRITQFTAPSDIDGVPTLESETSSSEPIEVLLRVPYQISALECETSRIQGQGVAINPRFVVLGLSKSYHPSPVPPPKEAVDRFPIQMEDFLHGYFELLQNAGHHILHYLPDFNNANFRHSSNFSDAVTNTTAVDSVWGIPTEKINKYLSMAWLNALILSSIPTVSLSTGPSLSLAEYHSASNPRSSNSSFNIYFLAPTVSAVCEQEVMITFNIKKGDHIDVYDDPPIHEFTAGKIVFLSTGGRILSLTRDPSNCIYMEQLSAIPQAASDPENTSTQDSSRIRSLLKDFFVAEYVPCLDYEDLRTLYDSDAISLSTDEETVGDLQSSNQKSFAKTNIRTTISTTSDVGDFDLVTAVSEAAINECLISNWQNASTARDEDNAMLAKWEHKESFEAEFAPMTIRLLDDRDHAVITIHMKSGYLRVGEAGFDRNEQSHPFHDWKLAFEVKLAKCRHGKIPGTNQSWITRFKKCPWFTRKRRGQAQDRDFCHIFANFDRTEVEFLPAFSHFAGLFPNLGNALQESLAKVKALVTHIRDEYLPKLMGAGYHILHTVEVSKDRKGRLGELTDFRFRVASDTPVTSRTLKNSHQSDPVIILAGVTTDKPLPELPLDHPLPWLVRMGRIMPSGAVCLSHEMFFEPEVLTCFSAVNAMTTMTSFFTKVDKAEWNIKLVPWAEDALRKNRVTNFCRDYTASEDGGLRYVWNHEERWEAKETGLSCLPPQEDQYTVSCRTLAENHLTIPTNYADDISIRIEGKVVLSMSYSGSQDSWAAQASASVTWGSNVLMRSPEKGGLQVSTCVDELTYKRNDPECDHGHIPENLLRKYFINAPDLSAVVALFRKFEEPWEFSYSGGLNVVNASFNTHGDLLFELRTTVEPDPSPLSVPATQGVSRDDLFGSDSNTPQGLGSA